MDNTLNEQIRIAIANDLSQQVSQELQKRLQQADDDRVKLAQANELLAGQRTTNLRLQEKVAELTAELARAGAVDVRERAVDERERNQKVFELEAQLKTAVQGQEFAAKVALGLVRNIEYRESVMHNTTTPVPMQTPGGYTAIQAHTTTDKNENTKTAQ